MGLSIWHLLLVLAIVLVLFGAKRLRNLGGDLGAAIKGFKDAVTDGKKEGEQPTETVATAQQPQQIPQQPVATPSPYAAAPAQPNAQPTVTPVQTTPPHTHNTNQH